MNPFDEYVHSETRRHFFARGSHAVGWAALASLMGTGANAFAGGADTGGSTLKTGLHHGAVPIHFASQGQARHLSAHGRRAVADGPLRLQAQDGRMVR